MSNLNWTYEEFLCFLLIYASHVDIEFSEDEKVRLQKTFGQETYQKMFSIFDDMSDYQSLQEILRYKDKYYNTPEKRQEVLDNIKLQFFIDGEYSTMEKEIYQFLEKLM